MNPVLLAVIKNMVKAQLADPNTRKLILDAVNTRIHAMVKAEAAVLTADPNPAVSAIGKALGMEQLEQVIDGLIADEVTALVALIK